MIRIIPFVKFTKLIGWFYVLSYSFYLGKLCTFSIFCKVKLRHFNVFYAWISSGWFVLWLA